MSPLGNIVRNYVENSTESSLTKFVDDKPGCEVDTSEGRDISQRDLGRLGERVSDYWMKFNKCKVLHLGQHNQRAQNRPGSVLGEQQH